MVLLSKALDAWGTTNFKDTLKREIAQLGVDTLRLQQTLASGSVASDNKLDVMILSVCDQDTFIRATAGIFYSGLSAGCNCTDDPSPPAEHNEYCEIQIEIDKVTAQATVALLS